MEETKKKIVDGFNYLVDDVEDELYDTEENNENEADIEDEYEKQLVETAFTIQKNLFDYVTAHGLPLCETLDINRIIRFIKIVN